VLLSLGLFLIHTSLVWCFFVLLHQANNHHVLNQGTINLSPYKNDIIHRWPSTISKRIRVSFLAIAYDKRDKKKNRIREYNTLTHYANTLNKCSLIEKHVLTLRVSAKNYSVSRGQLQKRKPKKAFYRKAILDEGGETGLVKPK
jgi:hypothetical protein